MKKLIIGMNMLIIFFGCQNSTDVDNKNSAITTAFDEQEELAEIMKVIEEETMCFFERNYDCWSKHWIHENYAFQAWNNDDGTFDAAIGWENIDNQGKDYIKNVPEGKTTTSHPFVIRENLQVKFYNDNLAYLIWKQYNADRERKYFNISQETRLMEKKAGDWKIVNVSAFWNAKTSIPIDSINIVPANNVTY
ncbi:hypothetical protein BH23BAC1_BH23BAC1_31300 [soil metagenome]